MPGMQPFRVSASFVEAMRRGVSVPHAAARGESGGNGGRRTTASGRAHQARFIFLPRQRAAHFVTLMDRNVAHPRAHTRPHMSHTLSLSHSNLHFIAFTWSHAHKVVDARAVTHRLLCPARFDIQREMFYDPPTWPSSLVNKLFPEVRVMHYHLAAHEGCSRILHHRPTHVHPAVPRGAR